MSKSDACNTDTLEAHLLKENDRLEKEITQLKAALDSGNHEISSLLRKEDKLEEQLQEWKDRYSKIKEELIESFNTRIKNQIKQKPNEKIDEAIRVFNSPLKENPPLDQIKEYIEYLYFAGQCLAAEMKNIRDK